MLSHDETYLKHYGILGMRWGRRRFENRASTTRGAINSNPVRSTTRGKPNLNPVGATIRGKANPNPVYSTRTTLSEKQKKALKIAGGVAAGALLVGATAYAIRTKKIRISAMKASAKKITLNGDHYAAQYADQMRKLELLHTMPVTKVPSASRLKMIDELIDAGVDVTNVVRW